MNSLQPSIADGRVEKLRADMYMTVMSELTPILRDAIEEAEVAQDNMRNALAYLGMVKRQVDQLDSLTEYDQDDPEAAIRETLTTDLLIRRIDRQTFVYFIEAGDYIKIGYSRDPIGRLVQIRKGQGVTTPDGLDTSGARVLAVEPGSFTKERFLHQRFAGDRVAGEWFRKNDRLTYYIKSIATPEGTTTEQVAA